MGTELPTGRVMMSNESSPLPERLYTTEEVANRLAVSIKSVHRWVTAGDLHTYRLGHQLRISEEDLRAFLDLRHGRDAGRYKICKRGE